MTLIAYTMMCEQTGPKQLVRDVVLQLTLSVTCIRSPTHQLAAAPEFPRRPPGCPRDGTSYVEVVRAPINSRAQTTRLSRD
jgi:hypothetical protein